MTTIWLAGDRWNQLYSFDTETGSYRLFTTDAEVGIMAGSAFEIARQFVAVYLDPNGHALFLRVNEVTYPVDGVTRGESSVRLADCSRV